MKTTKEELIKKIEKFHVRSAWNRGVKEYAYMILDSLDDNQEVNKKNLLNGSKDWKQYSMGGLALIYDKDIAETLCTPSELKRTKHGQLPPNSWEGSWLITQARALHQACELIMRIKGGEEK